MQQKLLRLTAVESFGMMEVILKHMGTAAWKLKMSVKTSGNCPVEALDTPPGMLSAPEALKGLIFISAAHVSVGEKVRAY